MLIFFVVIVCFLVSELPALLYICKEEFTVDVSVRQYCGKLKIQLPNVSIPQYIHHYLTGKRAAYIREKKKEEEDDMKWKKKI